MKLQEWIESEEKDYGIGLALLGKFSKNRVLLQNLSRKQNPKKLEYELKKAFEYEEAKSKSLAAKAKKKAGKKEKKEADAPVDETTGKKEPHSDQVIDQTNAEPGPQRLKIVRNDTEVKYEDLPEEIQKLWDNNRDAYKEIRSTHEKLKLMGKAPAEDRAPLLARIDELDSAIRKNWDVIDAWQPGAEAEEKKEPVAIDHKRINANRKYISTNLKKLADGNVQDKKIDEVKAIIQARYNELKDAGEEFATETLSELAKAGIEC
ncbi:hypothetical protein [Mangrovibacterium sp.]|uniref:hypothetical protein n=1 Tax=Mangrovibacterium sp. TaxID=1961364 RepID=UPI003561CB09